jgi:hypothetical protein
MYKLLFISLVFLTYHLCEKATWGFTVARLLTSHDLNFSNYEDPVPYLNQTFYLKDQGGQSFVFFSEDGRTVLKFFKDMPRPWLLWPSYQKKKLSKLSRTLQGYTLAMERLPESSALLALHFKTTKEPLFVTLVDRLHIAHRVDLSKVYFALQRKVDPLSSETPLTPLLEELKKAGLTDHDHRLEQNIGQDRGRLVFLDPGRFTLL